jgi:hypothetical protein
MDKASAAWDDAKDELEERVDRDDERERATTPTTERD